MTETTFLVLLSMFRPNHGYGIMQFIQEETGGRVVLGAGSLYGAINTLVKKKWIAPVGQDSGQKKEYMVTALGREMAQREMERMAQVSTIATKIMGGK